MKQLNGRNLGSLVATCASISTLDCRSCLDCMHMACQMLLHLVIDSVFKIIF